MYYGHKPSGGRSHWKGDYADTTAKPLFAFGHGLSFTRFTYSDLEIEPAIVEPQGHVRISARVTNSGPRRGEEVMQLYVQDVVGSVTRPVKELRGFARVPLDPGQTRSVTFDLAADQLAFHDRDLRLVVEPGRIEVSIGASSEDIRLAGHFEIAGARTEIRGPRTYTTPVTIAD